MKKLISLSVVVLMIAGLLSSCGTAENKKVLKLAHSLDTEHPVHKGMAFMAERLEEISEGKMAIEIYPGGQLGSEQQCVELLQIGSLAITKVSAAVMEGFNEEYKIFGLPYVFRDKEHGFKVFDGEIGEALLKGSEKFNIRGLCFYDAGYRSFYTKDKPVETPEDLKGKKIRVMKSNTAVSMIKAFGGSPTPISWGELYTALQSGVVDGAENNPPSFYLSHHYEVCKFYSLNEHTGIPDVLIMSDVIHNKLSDQEKAWLAQAVKESVVVQRKLWAESEEESLRKVQEAGVTVIRPDKEKFAEKVEEVYALYSDNPKIAKIIKEIRAIQ